MSRRKGEAGGGKRESGRTWLFVYGTLRRAERMTRVLGNEDRWRYLGPVTVRGEVYPLGRYRALRIARGGTGRVEGLLVELQDGREALRRLDAYEGTDDGLYRRRRCRVTTEHGETRSAWVYVGGPAGAEETWLRRRSS